MEKDKTWEIMRHWPDGKFNQDKDAKILNNLVIMTGTGGWFISKGRKIKGWKVLFGITYVRMITGVSVARLDEIGMGVEDSATRAAL